MGNIPDYNKIIERLEKDLISRQKKLWKNPTHYNKLQYNRTKSMLDIWIKNREDHEKSKNQH